jgi:hypothetical protein
MLGLEDADPVLIEPKYENLLKCMNNIVQAWSIFFKSSVCQNIIIPHTQCGGELEKFVIESLKFLESQQLAPEENKIQTKFTNSLETDLYELGSKYNKVALNKAYRELKNSDLMKHFTITLNNIKILLEDDRSRTGAIFSCLDVPQSLSASFIKKTALNTKILNWCSLDFGFLYSNLVEYEKDFNDLVLMALRITYVNTCECYKILMQPDIDIEKFVEAFSKKLDEVKGIISGCDSAFKTLKKSLGLLKRNFSDYYKKFMTTSQNPGIIFESFLTDVANKNKNNPAILMQFKKIIGHIKNNLPNDLKENLTVSKLWGISEELFNNMEGK